MKVVLRSSSILFAVLTISLNAPIARVRRKETKAANVIKKPPVREETIRESKYWNRVAL